MFSQVPVRSRGGGGGGGYPWSLVLSLASGPWPLVPIAGGGGVTLDRTYGYPLDRTYGYLPDRTGGTPQIGPGHGGGAEGVTNQPPSPTPDRTRLGICYATGGMLLAVAQEDFLVLENVFCWHEFYP